MTKSLPKRLRVAQVAPLFESVPPKGYGGTERVVYNLTEGLTALGHEVTLFASGDSTTSARLIPGCPEGLRLNPKVKDPVAPHVLQVERAHELQERFDIIHFHVDYLHFPLLKYFKTPVLTTTHGRLDQPELLPLYKNFNEAALSSISFAQRRLLPENNWVGNVYHGLPAGLYKPSFKPGTYLAFLGRISPEKGLDSAIEIAKRMNMPLKVAAKIDKVDQDYYLKEIRHLMQHPLIEYVGEIGEIEKSSFLAGAKALLFPICWPEPFGMVMIEAMACGTPVLAFENGSVPEVVDDGVTGVVANSVEEALEKAPKLLELDRRLVRAVFEKRFSQMAMTNNYIEIYRELIDQANLLQRFSGRETENLEAGAFL